MTSIKTYQFYFHFLYGKVGKTGLSDLAISVFDADGTEVVVDDTDFLEIGYGAYKYSFVPTDPGDFLAICRTSDATVSQQHIAAFHVAEQKDFVADDCIRVYEYAFNPTTKAPMTACKGTARIVTLPFDSDSKLWSGKTFEGYYDADTGKIYWDMPVGATVMFRIADLGVNISKVVPSSPAEIRISDI